MLAGTAVAAGDVSAQTRVPVRFSRGASSVTLRGALRRFQARDYVIRAKSGQTLDLHVTGTNELTVFTVFLPGGGSIEGATEMEEFNGEVPRDGEYVIRVLMQRAAAREKGSFSKYKLRISIK
jgi:hypothetical protein